MKDFALEANTNNFRWKNSSLTMTESYLEYMSQKVRCCLSLLKGEWYLDTRLGIPYIPSWEEDNDGHRSILESAIRVKIAGIDGIKKLLSFSSELEKKTRRLSVSFSAQCDNGETLEMQNVKIGGEEE